MSHRHSLTALMFALIGLMGLTACAGGTKYSQMTLPPVPDGQGRLVFYRDGMFLGFGVQPDVKLNGQAVGKSQPNGFFFVDAPAGHHQVACMTEWEHKIALDLPPNETRYVKTNIVPGVLVGHVVPEVVPAERAIPTLQNCSYIGAPLPGAATKPTR